MVLAEEVLQCEDVVMRARMIEKVVAIGTEVHPETKLEPHYQ